MPPLDIGFWLRILSPIVGFIIAGIILWQLRTNKTTQPDNKLVSSPGDDKKKDPQESIKPKVQVVAHMERIKEENILLKQQITAKRKQTPPGDENKINTNDITLNAEALRKAQTWLDEIIKKGEELIYDMKTPGFNWAQLELWIQRWLTNIDSNVWKVTPQYAKYITEDQGTFTTGEILKYHNWNKKEASLRVMVDRKLLRLREVRAKLPI